MQPTHSTPRPKRRPTLALSCGEIDRPARVPLSSPLSLPLFALFSLFALPLPLCAVWDDRDETARLWLQGLHIRRAGAAPTPIRAVFAAIQAL
eukprot:909619-Rhodomonas_salina.1